MSLTKVTYSMIQGAPLNAIDFGAKGNGTDDDTDALQLFFDAVSSGKRLGVINAGDYVVSSTLTISSATSISSFAIVGEVAVSALQGSASIGTRFLWSGAAGGTVVEFTNVRDAEISNIYFVPKTTENIGVCLSVDGINSTNVTASIGASPASGTVQTGVLLAYTATSGCDLHKLEGLEFSGLTNGVYIYHDQSKFNIISNSNITYCTNGINALAGSFTSYSCNFGHNTIDILLESNTDNISIYAPQSELSGRFISATKETSAAFAINVFGGRVVTNAASLNVDGRYISVKSGGPVNLYGVEFASGVYTAAWRIYADNSPASSNSNSQINVYGCAFPNQVVYEQPNTTVVTMLGCRGLTSGGAHKTLPNVIDSSTYNQTSGFVVAPSVYELAADATNVDASLGGDFLTAANTVATAITSISNGKKGQTITIAGGSSTNATTIADSGVFKLTGAITLNVNTTLILKTYDGTNWLEMSRSVN